MHRWRHAIRSRLAAGGRSKERPQPSSDQWLVAGFTFPDYERLPAGRAQGFDIPTIARFVPFQLRQPVSLI
jgi:hypothetical protein